MGTVTSNYTLTADSGHGHQSLQTVLLSAIQVRSVVQHLDGEEKKSDHDDTIHLPQAHTQNISFSTHIFVVCSLYITCMRTINGAVWKVPTLRPPQLRALSS